MSLELYGSFQSRTRRSLWAALELGVEFHHVPISAQDGALKDAAFRQINPLGRIPALRDGTLAISESLAINLYLAKVYGQQTDPALYPAWAEAKLLQWSFFAASDLDPWVVVYRKHTVLLPEAEREPKLAEFGRQAIEQSLDHLESALTAQSHVAAPHFTIADLNVVSVLQPLVFMNYAFDAHPAVRAWIDASLGRPAAQAALQYP